MYSLVYEHFLLLRWWDSVQGFTAAAADLRLMSPSSARTARYHLQVTIDNSDSKQYTGPGPDLKYIYGCLLKLRIGCVMGRCGITRTQTNYLRTDLHMPPPVDPIHIIASRSTAIVVFHCRNQSTFDLELDIYPAA
jgi:hypothetical protein